MFRTNTSIQLYRETIDWQGNRSSELLGTFDGWIEEGSNLVFVRNKEGKVGVTEMGMGTLFLFSDIDLSNCYFIEDGKRREIVQKYRYVDGKNRFHHIEVIYK